MSNAKNTSAKNDVEQDGPQTVNSTENEKATTVPQQTVKATLLEGAGEDGKDIIVISDDDIVDEPSFYQKAKSVAKRNRKLIAFTAVAVVTAVLYKLAQNVELEEGDETTDDEVATADETLEV